MRVKINNVGKVKNADIEINGITVVAGENVTGKSTISKSLYAFLELFITKMKRSNPSDYLLSVISFYFCIPIQNKIL